MLQCDVSALVAETTTALTKIASQVGNGSSVFRIPRADCAGVRIHVAAGAVVVHLRAVWIGLLMRSNVSAVAIRVCPSWRRYPRAISLAKCSRSIHWVIRQTLCSQSSMSAFRQARDARGPTTQHHRATCCLCRTPSGPWWPKPLQMAREFVGISRPKQVPFRGLRFSRFLQSDLKNSGLYDPLLLG
jgi:hypothetical protein